MLKTLTSRVPPPPAARPALISAAVRLLSSRLARSLRPFAPSLRTLLEVCGGLRPCLALCRMSGPFARFGGLVGCTLLDVCGRLRALDIYIYICIYTPVYLTVTLIWAFFLWRYIYIYTHLYIYILIEQMVVVMAGDDGDEQRTERTERVCSSRCFEVATHRTHAHTLSPSQQQQQQLATASSQQQPARASNSCRAA